MRWDPFVRPGGRLSIRRQLFVAVTGLHLILMVSFVADMLRRQHGYLEERSRARTVQQAAATAASIEGQLLTRDYASIRDIVRALSRDSAIRSVSILDQDKRIIAHTDRTKMQMAYQDRSIMAALESTEPVIFRQDSAAAWAVAPVRLGGTSVGWAIVAGDLTADHAELASIRQRGFMYAAIALLIAAGFALALSSAITHQLRLLLAGAERMSHDVLDEPVPVVTENDVGVVARAVNLAMEKLRHERTRLTAAHAKLEAEVTERRRAEKQLHITNEALANANDQLRQFAYAASHDLQEPLRSVTSYSHLLRSRYKGTLDTDAEEFIDFIHSGATRMQRLIKALLDYSRAGGPGEEPPRTVAAGDALRLALDNLSLAIEDSEASVVGHDLPKVRAHEVAVVQLFQNLVGNAIKYSGTRRPEIHIRAERTDADKWIFTVEDNGIGIDPSQHKRIFGLFKRAHGTEYPGTGVGLAICVKLVERYGGRIWVESEPGRGSAFRFTLPAAEDEGAPSKSNGVAA